MDPERFSLAQLVDWLALPGGPRDRALVLRTAAWLHEHRLHLELELAAAAGLRDVMVTLRADGDVRAVVTGRRADLPGEWTCTLAEGEFPVVWLRGRDEAVAAPVGFAALDFSVRGRQVRLPTGDRATAHAVALVGGVARVRVRLASGAAAVFDRADVDLLEAP